MTGTSLAQAIPIAISPILTRIYTPNEFGFFAFYIAITSILVVMVTGRYEMAILLPKKDSDAMNLVALSATLSFFVSFIIFIVIMIFNEEIVSLIGVPELSVWLYWVPVSTLLMGIYQSLNYWSNRKSHYKRLAVSRVVQSSSTGAAQLAGAINSIGITGLVGGQLFGQVFSTGVLSKLIYNEDSSVIKKIKFSRVIFLAKKYADFPKFLIFAHGFNTASGQMPALLLNALFNSATAGFFMLTQRVMGAPMTLVASAIGDVFRQEASYAYVNKGSCREIYIRTFKKLLIISCLPSVIFFFIAPELFSKVFGEEWRVAGEYAQILSPVFFLRFIASPLSVMFMIAEKQKLDLIWQIILLIATSVAFFIGYFYSSEKIALIFYSIAYSIMFAVNFFMTFYFASGKKNCGAVQ
jgi:O-antigen/teichoic acid export membrane protein